MTKRILITGAAGFIGFHLAEALLKAGHAVLGIDNLSNYYPIALKQDRVVLLKAYPQFEFHQLDLTDWDGMAKAFQTFAPSHVAHLAAQAGVRQSITQPRPYIASNVDGFLSVLECCRNHAVEHLVYASSSSVYGSNSKVPFHEDDPVLHPISIYAASKRANELMAQSYAHLFRIPISGLRFFTVYGPWGRPDMAYFAFTKAVLEGKPITLFNHGKMERDFTFVDDVTAAIAALLPKPPQADAQNAHAPHRIYNIGNHTPVTLERFVAAIEAATGRIAERLYQPMQPGDVPSTFADVSRLAAIAGFQPSTTIETGMERFVAWYLAYHT
jgi:UDP-glucuronate 4-epimerase